MLDTKPSFTRAPRLYRTSSSDSIFTVASSTSTSSDEYHPRQHSRHAPPSRKSSTEQILVRARNANIPAIFSQTQKKIQLKKQKTKSREQLEAEERRMLERKAELEDDPLLDASKMRPDKVWCIPCNKYIQIDSRRSYYATLWYKHRSKRHGGAEVCPLAPKATRASAPATKKAPVALAAPLIDDEFAIRILADMYSKSRGLRLLSLAAESLT